LAGNLVQLVLVVVQLIGMWKAFEKAGQPGWAAIVPFYNVFVMCQIAGKEWWWIFIVLCVPIVGALLLNIAIAEKYGQGAGFAIGLTCCGFIFWPILGFGSSQYEGGRRGRRRARDEDEDEDDDDRPRRRARDEEEEEEEERPRRRARDEDEDEDEDRPRKRRPRDDDDD
jgi:hypothetical protein